MKAKSIYVRPSRHDISSLLWVTYDGVLSSHTCGWITGLWCDDDTQQDENDLEIYFSGYGSGSSFDENLVT